LAELFSVSTGFEVNHEKGNLNFLDAVPAYYYLGKDFSFIKTEKDDNGVYGIDDSTAAVVRLDTRKYSNTYVTIPLAIKMKTNEIGYLTYFGEFGLNLGFRAGSRVTDQAIIDSSFSNGVELGDLSKLINTSDMAMIRTQLSIGAGAEYNLSGSTSVFGAIHYNLGFTNSARTNSRFMVDNNGERFNQSFSAQGVRLTVGVLF